MPNPKVFVLRQNEFTIPAAADIKPQTQPTIQFERVGGDIYQLNLSIQMKIVQENLGENPIDISPSGNSYNVLKSAMVQKCKTSKVVFTLIPTQLGGIDDFEIRMDLRMVIPGSKGDNGN